MTRLAIVGSREFTDYERFCLVVDGYHAFEASEIVSGGARGTDTMAERYAFERNIPIKVHVAEWNVHGKSAGPIRNQKIVDDADEMIAFVNKHSIGTFDSIRRATKKGIPVVMETIEE